MHPDHERYARACDYPGILDESAVEKSLSKLLTVLGVSRKIARLGPGWSLQEFPTLEKDAKALLEEIKPALAEVNALEVQAERAARTAHHALNGLDAPDVREVLTAIAAQVSYEAVGSIGPGGAHMSEDEMNDVALGQARRALVIGAGILTKDDLDAIAAEGVRRNNERLRSPSLFLPWAGAAALNAREAAGALDEARTRLFGLIGTRKASAVPAPFAGRAGCAFSGESCIANSARLDRHAGDALYAPLAFRDVRVLRTAFDARGSSEALRSFAAWVIQSCGWEHADLALITTKWFGASTEQAKAWTKPLFEAFVAGAWMIHWTEDTLFWAAKPTLHLEARRRLHRADGPALESDVQNHYFWHGVRVPAFVVTRPESITPPHIESERNAEVRRVMIERMGIDRYITASNLEPVQSDDSGTLYRKEQLGDEPLVVVKVRNSTAEPDGSFKEYFLRVPPTVTTAREAVAWTFGMTAEQYLPRAET